MRSQQGICATHFDEHELVHSLELKMQRRAAPLLQLSRLWRPTRKCKLGQPIPLAKPWGPGAPSGTNDACSVGLQVSTGPLDRKERRTCAHRRT